MNRKRFLASGTAILATPFLSAFTKNTNDNDDELVYTVPPKLKKGATIGITSPAGFITLEGIQPCMQQLEDWGLNVRPGSTIGKRDYTFGGTDSERIEDFQQMLDDPTLKAILCARGGYGMVRIIDKLSFEKFLKHPKWIIGFSDITVLHAHLNRNYGVASIHSKMCNSFPDDWTKAEPIQVETILSIKKALMGEHMRYEIPPSDKNRVGMCEGVLIGGNLKTLESLAGSNSDIKTAGKILFLEDTGEYLYSIDRMFWNLKRTKKLDKLAGLIIGGFKIKPDDPGEEFGKTLKEIVLEKISTLKYPVCFDFPVGHQKNNFALKCGVRHRLRVNTDSVTLVEL